MSWIPALDICHRLSNISLKTKCWVLATQSHVIPIKISPYPGMSRLIFEFHAKLLRERKRGTWKLCDIANMDQTPLPFVFHDGTTYDAKGSKEI